MELRARGQNQILLDMAEVLTERVESHTKQGSEPARPPFSPTRSSLFKYYIHDSIKALRFQLIGDLHRSNLSDLNGSWETAKTTLGPRRLVLDLARLQSTDEEGDTWLRKMKDAGAETLPIEYWAGSTGSSLTPAPRKPMTLISKMRGLFRSLSDATKCH